MWLFRPSPPPFALSLFHFCSALISVHQSYGIYFLARLSLTLSAKNSPQYRLFTQNAPRPPHPASSAHNAALHWHFRDYAIDTVNRYALFNSQHIFGRHTLWGRLPESAEGRTRSTPEKVATCTITIWLLGRVVARFTQMLKLRGSRRDCRRGVQNRF